MTGKKAYAVLAALLALNLILGAIIYYTARNRDLKVIFFDVGQGDAILISEGNNQILIDGGRSGKTILEKLGKYVPFWDRNIEAIIATHPDVDHIGGLIDVAKNYKVGTIMETGAASDSQTYKTLEDLIGSKNIPKAEALKGVNVQFPGGAEALIIYPFSSIAGSGQASNDSSVAAKLIFRENSFLFTGDLPAEKEAELISTKSDIGANILKIAHHGSKYSTSDEFLSTVSPKEAVISVGKINSYGHPAPEVVDRLLRHGAKVWRTDEMGDIIYKCKISPPKTDPPLAEKCKIEFE